MGRIDVESKAYMSNRERFADVFNFSLYSGKNVIQPNNLSPMDTSEMALPYGINSKMTTQKYRDLLKMYSAMRDDKMIYLILGLELQTHVHYAMPVRAMLYDALNYAGQVAEAATSYRENKTNLSKTEFLSGLRKEDKLIPVITLVISFDTEPWDGHTSLHEMLGINDPQILQYIPDYKLNLLTPAQIDDKEFDKFRTGLGAVMQFIKHRNDKDLGWMLKNKRFEKMDRETVNFIKTVTGADIRFNEEGEVIDMWAAWENGINEARTKGRSEGMINTAMMFAKKYNIPTEEAIKTAGVTKEEWDAYEQSQIIKS